MEQDDLKSVERLRALVVHVGDAGAAEGEAREEQARQRQVKVELVRGRDLPRLDVEVLDAALGGVLDEAPDLRGLELAGVDDEGEAVDAAARARLARRAPSAERRGNGGGSRRRRGAPTDPSTGRATRARPPPCGQRP